MNEVFLIGKVISDIEFKFIINSNNISIAMFEIITIQDKQIIRVKAYNEIADYIYQHIKQNDCIAIEGKIRDGFIEIENLDRSRLDRSFIFLSKSVYFCQKLV